MTVSNSLDSAGYNQGMDASQSTDQFGE